MFIDFFYNARNTFCVQKLIIKFFFFWVSNLIIKLIIHISCLLLNFKCLYICRYIGARTRLIKIQNISGNHINSIHRDLMEEDQPLTRLYHLEEGRGCALEKSMLVWIYWYSCATLSKGSSGGK